MKGRFLALLVPPTAWLVVFLVLPTAALATSAFSTRGLSALLEPVTWLLVWRSFRIAAAATVLCLLVAYPVAYYIAGCSPRWRNVLLFLIVLPFWTNLLVRIYALMYVLRPMGILFTEGAVLLGLVHSFLPFMVLPLYGSIEKLPTKLLEAAQDLGASPLRAFWKVTVPLTMPGIAAGCILVFIPVFGIFALPEFLGGAAVAMIGNQINLYFMRTDNPDAGSALTLVLMVLTVALTWIYHRLRRSEGLV